MNPEFDGLRHIIEGSSYLLEKAIADFAEAEGYEEDPVKTQLVEELLPENYAHTYDRDPE